jgi:hypothetical protein
MSFIITVAQSNGFDHANELNAMIGCCPHEER